MSSRPDSRPSPEGRLRHSYDALFGDAPAEPDPVASPEPDDSADAPNIPEPLPTAAAPEAPVDDVEPYRPAGARAEHQPIASGPTSVPARKVDLDPGADAPPVRAAYPVDTGRLYHSVGAQAAAEATGAIPALPNRIPPSDPAPAPAAAAGDTELDSAPSTDPEESPPVRYEAIASQPLSTAPATSVVPDPPNRRRSPGTDLSGAGDERGLTYLGVIIVVGAPTLLVGLAQAVIWNRIGWITGLVLLAASCYAAFTARRADHSAAVVVPPLAFLVTVLVAGQLTLPDGVSLFVREGFMVVRTLAENAPWVLGATALAAIIVLVRRRRVTTR